MKTLIQWLSRVAIVLSVVGLVLVMGLALGLDSADIRAAMWAVFGAGHALMCKDANA